MACAGPVGVYLIAWAAWAIRFSTPATLGPAASSHSAGSTAHASTGGCETASDGAVGGVRVVALPSGPSASPEAGSSTGREVVPQKRQICRTKAGRAKLSRQFLTFSLFPPEACGRAAGDDVSCLPHAVFARKNSGTKSKETCVSGKLIRRNGRKKIRDIKKRGDQTRRAGRGRKDARDGRVWRVQGAAQRPQQRVGELHLWWCASAARSLFFCETTDCCCCCCMLFSRATRAFKNARALLVC